MNSASNSKRGADQSQNYVENTVNIQNNNTKIAALITFANNQQNYNDLGHMDKNMHRIFYKLRFIILCYQQQNKIVKNYIESFTHFHKPYHVYLSFKSESTLPLIVYTLSISIVEKIIYNLLVFDPKSVRRSKQNQYYDLAMQSILDYLPKRTSLYALTGTQILIQQIVISIRNYILSTRLQYNNKYQIAVQHLATDMKDLTCQIISQLQLKLQIKKQLEKYMKTNSHHFSNPVSSISTVAADLEYELNRCFINRTRDQLMVKEMEVMMESNLLIQTLSKLAVNMPKQSTQHKLRVKTQVQDKDTSLHMLTSNTLDSLLAQQDQHTICKPKTRPFARRNANNPNPTSNMGLNKTGTRTSISNNTLSHVLEDIKQNCAVKTYSTINSIIQEYNTLKSNKNTEQSNNKSKIVRSKCQTDRNGPNDHTIILTARNMKLQNQISALNIRIEQLQQRLSSTTNQLLTLKSTPFKPITSTPIIPTLSHTQFSTILHEHDKQIHKHIQKVSTLHHSILSGLQVQIIDVGCNRCCVLVKKVKDSLAAYKDVLNQQIITYRNKLHIHHHNTNITTNTKV